MAHEKNHDYHILNPSIWPFVGSLGAFIMLFGLRALGIARRRTISPGCSSDRLVGVLYVMFAWWAEVVHESTDRATIRRWWRSGLRYGFIMFIMSEVMFFAAWFWSFFQARDVPDPPRGPARRWMASGRPRGLRPSIPWHLPLINTLILLLSGCAATWAHHAIAHENNRKDLVTGLAIAIVLGVIFTGMQAYEYTHAAFGFAGNIYGANFFMATGFHGFHVIIGTIFLTVCLFRALAGHFTPERHIGFEAAAWYWHFVDVVWLFLFAAVYIWGRRLTRCRGALPPASSTLPPAVFRER
jgi:cytochrome c oxidase subunit 3